MANYIIGDIQGCFQGLQKLLAKVDFNPSKDVLWSVGDLVARGEDSLGTLIYLMELKDSFRTVLGNHDLHLLSIASGIKPAKKNDNLTDLLASPDINKICQWLREKPLALSLDEHNHIVHAGLYPQWSTRELHQYSKEVESQLSSNDYEALLKNMYGSGAQTWSESLSGYPRLKFIIDACTRMRFLHQDYALDFKCKTAPDVSCDDPKLLPWFTAPNPNLNAQERIFFGHWASLMGNTQTNTFIGLDTGYVWGNTMTLFHFEKNEKVSIDF
ncbi:symmetrical bis(5'-nucleosyl)-tetraphosphatase [Aestuariibacter sp. AA17]|uniref:bis(5'-nucleosyl)-tetraphosphatase (symmetrical) n=1 Tax=Fluctibacter corallii TaxID=2984329 RepID=A0ABT3A4U8_9ALTE|nr:symmetrical bis(5'-nucleosyl)-tetraphosphatase [Aestuariibacter sp. AA17]MCV2883569.1 symmetrical bis(5'-nucleosyl)-tetraphosphatase [Aestuariibacter sp. AA17]